MELAMISDEGYCVDAGGEDIPLSFDSPDSQMILRGDYDPFTETMTVEFKRPGANVYVYSGIEAKLWLEFEQAASKGSFFAKRIRPFFTGKAKP